MEKQPKPDTGPPKPVPGTDPEKQKPGTEPEKQKTGTDPEKQKPGTEPEKQKPGTEPEKQKPGTDPGQPKPDPGPPKPDTGTPKLPVTDTEKLKLPVPEQAAIVTKNIVIPINKNTPIKVPANTLDVIKAQIAANKLVNEIKTPLTPEEKRIAKLEAKVAAVSEPSPNGKKPGFFTSRADTKTKYLENKLKVAKASKILSDNKQLKKGISNTDLRKQTFLDNVTNKQAIIDERIKTLQTTNPGVDIKLLTQYAKKYYKEEQSKLLQNKEDTAKAISKISSNKSKKYTNKEKADFKVILAAGQKGNPNFTPAEAFAQFEIKRQNNKQPNSNSINTNGGGIKNKSNTKLNRKSKSKSNHKILSKINKLTRHINI